MRRSSLAFVLLLLAGLTASTALAGDHRVVETRGDFQFQPNAFIRSDMRFTPGPLTVASGDTVTWRNNTVEPHTVTIVSPEDLPGRGDDPFECFAPGGPCDTALGGHFGAGEPVIEVGEPGLDAPGDSRIFFPGEEIAAVVSAPSGTTLHYLCALHPWMQGEIKVR